MNWGPALFLIGSLLFFVLMVYRFTCEAIADFELTISKRSLRTTAKIRKLEAEIRELTPPTLRKDASQSQSIETLQFPLEEP